MRARTCATIILCCAALLPAVAQAEWLCNFTRSVVQDFKRRNCWPQPFVDWDRADAAEPFSAMVENGWRQQNLLGDYHFREGTTELTEAGRLKVRWILLEAPEQHRVIYVHRTLSEADTAARVMAVQRCAAEYHQPSPQIVTTDISPYGWPAERIDTLNRKYQATIPDPRLPKSSGGGGTSSN